MHRQKNYRIINIEQIAQRGAIFLLVGCKAIIGSFSEDMKGI
jgi:hypothetical protein